MSRRYRIDTLLAAAVAVPVAVPFVIGNPGVTLLGAVFNAGTVLPLIWRRRAPFTVALTIAAFATAVSAYHRPGQMLQYGGLVAAYTVAELAEHRWQRWGFLLGLLVCIPPGAVFVKHNTAPEFLFTLLLPVSAWLLGTLARSNRARNDALAHRAGQLERQRAADTARAAAEERARIARDMHDVLAHAVSVMVVQAEAGPLVVRSDPDRAERVFDAIAESGREAMVQLRRSLGVLKDSTDAPQLTPQPTVATIPELVARVGATHLRVEMLVTGAPQPLPLDAELAAYRIVQEGLTNTVKHAAATAATVRLKWAVDGLVVEVRDDGHGPADTASGGQGLTGVHERAAACGGHAEAGPIAGGGFQVTAWLPYVGAAA